MNLMQMVELMGGDTAVTLSLYHSTLSMYDMVIDDLVQLVLELDDGHWLPPRRLTEQCRYHSVLVALSATEGSKEE